MGVDTIIKNKGKTVIDLKKVLIISYFYSPANFVACDRIKGFAEHMHKGGVKPIIITRNWNENQTTLTEQVTDNAYRHEVYETHEVYRMPYIQTLRDKLATKKKLRIVQRLLTLKEIILSHFSIRSLPYSNLYTKAYDLINKDDEIIGFIVSGGPFLAFQIGYKLKRQHPKLFWIPDYRDEWTTHQFFTKRKGVLEGLLSRLMQRSETKWISNSTFFSTTSQGAVERIGSRTEKKGVLILNGYNKPPRKTENLDKKDQTNRLKLAYYGTVYAYQNFDPVFSTLKTLQDESSFFFIGTEMNPDQKQRLEIETEGLNNVRFINRMRKPKLDRFIEDIDILVLSPYDSVTDWYPAKIFDYYSTGKLIVLIKSDNGVMSEFIEKTNCGVVCENADDFSRVINEVINKKKLSVSIAPIINEEYGSFFSRENQSVKLSLEIHSRFQTIAQDK